jgi:predicted  nucleic acid-binding Zn-ribbon protein
MGRRKNNTDFLKEAIEIHGDKFNYLSPYIKSKEHIKIQCLECTFIFKQIPNSHLMGRGCPQCAIKIKNFNKTKTNTQFLKEAFDIHNNRYEYLEEYKKKNIKIKIKCLQCYNIFEKTPDKHINSKQGCYNCYSSNNGLYNEEYFKSRITEKQKEADLYLCKFWNENEEFYKVGIATNIRYFNHKSKYKTKLISKIKTTLYEAFQKEQQFLKDYKQFRYIPQIKFNGHTECFSSGIFGGTQCMK